MRLTILGSSASYPGPGQACQGHLVTYGRTRVLLDCGNGVVGNLGKVMDPLSLDAVFITHAHPDHFLDLYALQGAVRYGPQGPAEPLTLYAPKGLFARMTALHPGKGGEDMQKAFVSHDLLAGDTVVAGELTVEAPAVTHIEGSVGLRVSAAGKTLFYTSDAKASEALTEAARGCDLLLAEATLPEAYAGRVPHMTAGEAADLAREAGAKMLVLTHLWPTASRSEILDVAVSRFSGEVVVAEEMLSLGIGEAGARSV